MFTICKYPWYSGCLADDEARFSWEMDINGSWNRSLKDHLQQLLDHHVLSLYLR